MKKKNEEKVPEQGCDTKMSAEKETMNEVVNNETVQEEVAEEQHEDSEEDSPDDKEGGTVDIHASGDEFLEFLSKLLRMMKSIIELQKRLFEFEKDPTFNMLMDLCMTHLQEMKESDKESESSDKDSDDDDKDDCCDTDEDDCDDDEDTITEAFISMKVKKVRP